MEWARPQVGGTSVVDVGASEPDAGRWKCLVDRMCERITASAHSPSPARAASTSCW